MIQYAFIFGSLVIHIIIETKGERQREREREREGVKESTYV